MTGPGPQLKTAVRRTTPHEQRIALRLAGIQDAGLANEESRPLRDALATGAMQVSALLEFAVGLARTLAAMHRRGVLHLNINPAHILLHGVRQSPSLIGFELATTFAEERPGFTHHREIRGNLPYLSPEQTGRTGRSVDLRADLYSLGVTLYEAATGHLPFEAQDPLQLLHDQLVVVPVPPLRLRADLPVPLSLIIERLLEKEPERRYQSTDGLLHDLDLVHQQWLRGSTDAIALGERDFPIQLSAPSRLVGRSVEIGGLESALDEAVQGFGLVVLVAGAPGVGKTSLINELRPLVTGRRGWFVSGKFDQYRHDAPTATVQALRALGRLLLAESEADLAVYRERILRALGANAALVCTMPEYATLLGPQAEVTATEPAQAEARLLATVVELLRAVASPQRPIVLVLDDLQWAAAVSVRFIDAVLYAEPIPGLLLVASYRQSAIDAAHPLAAALARWQGIERAPLRMELQNLPTGDLQSMLQEMMRLTRPQAEALTEPVAAHTGGNPYDTIELLNALRGDGALRPGAAGWEWDRAALRRYVGHSGVLDLLAARISRIPAAGRAVLDVMVCLGGQVQRSLLCAAYGISPVELDEHLVEPLEDGLLVIEPGEDIALRMRHDRVQQAVYGSMEAGQRRATHLAIARRLVNMPQFQIVALEQYLPAVDDITDPAECSHVARLLHAASSIARGGANFSVAQRVLAAALALVSRLPAPAVQHENLRAAIEIDLHVVLCSMGRFEQADAMFHDILLREAPVEDWIDAACAQVDSLFSRSRSHEALALGLPLAGQMGLEVPADFADTDIDERVAKLKRWCLQLTPGVDDRPYTGDRRTTAVVKLLNRLSYPAYMVNGRILGWLILESVHLWNRFGPSAALVPMVASLASLCGVAISTREDDRGAYLGACHGLKVSEARGWEPQTSESRFTVAVHSAHWFEPLEHVIEELKRAREGLLRSGELLTGCYVYRATTTAMLDCSDTLDRLASEIETGLQLAFRLRSDYVVAMLTIDGQLVRSLRAEDAPVRTSGEALACLERQAGVPAVKLSSHCTRALRGALMDDVSELEHHAQAAMEFVARLASYRGAQARVLQAYSLLRRARDAPHALRAVLLGEFEVQRRWLARCSEDAPDNFLHLLYWLDAERAWADSDTRAAGAAFDAALSQGWVRSRPWHHALISERCGLFHIEHGMSISGRHFMAQALHLVRAWGAQAKVRQLQAQHDFLRVDAEDHAARLTASIPAARPVDNIDALAILRASQALSSETSLSRLVTRVIELMKTLTGASAVSFAVCDEDRNGWTVSLGPASDAPHVPLDTAGARGLLPVSAFRYAERTREPLLVHDAARDDRFARDPYFARLPHCSLLVVPILSKGRLRAMLLLENRLSRRAFTTAGLDAVSLIAGQLAVSLENALLYDRLEQRVRQQTRELLATARRAGMAQIATNVLHNVGNVLNNVNVSAKMLDARVRRSRSTRVEDLARLLESNASRLPEFLSGSGKGGLIPRYVRDLAQALAREREEMLLELEHMGASVDHINKVVAMQLSYAGATAVLETCSIPELVDDVLRLQQAELERHEVHVHRDLAPAEPAALDRTRLMLILVNLVENAIDAMRGVQGERGLRIAVRKEAAEISVTVSDNGAGIPAENLARMFVHGFTTKPDGHGFGLHSCAMAAREMGGSISVHSAGRGRGAAFTLKLPASDESAPPA